MFAAVYSWRAMGPAVLDPEIGIDFSRLVHGAQEFTWGEPVVAGDELTTGATSVEDPARAVDDGPGRPRAGRGGRRSAGAEVAFRAVPRHGRPRAGHHHHLQ